MSHRRRIVLFAVGLVLAAGVSLYLGWHGAWSGQSHSPPVIEAAVELESVYQGASAVVQSQLAAADLLPVSQSEAEMRHKADFGGAQVQWTQRWVADMVIPTAPSSDWKQLSETMAVELERHGHRVSIEPGPAQESLTLNFWQSFAKEDDVYELPVLTWELTLQTPFHGDRRHQPAPGGDQALPQGFNAMEEIDSAERPVLPDADDAEEPAAEPRLALVIDDWGFPSAAARSLLQYPYPLTMAILPFLSHSESLALQGAEAGHEIILHQPMEARNPDLYPGDGAIYVDMSAEAIREQLELNIAHLAVIAGVNNHMGSRATEDRRVMDIVLSFLAERNLYFLDSLTTNASVVSDAAEQIGIPYAVNRFFIDNVMEQEAIEDMMRHALVQAEERGSLIVIGHVRSSTARAMWAMIPEIAASDVELVPVSELLRFPQRP